MTANLKRQKWIKAIALLAIIIAIAVVALPWKSWVEKRLITVFEAKGFENVQLSVTAIGPKGISLKNVSVGSNPPLMLGDVTVDYTLRELWQGDVNQLAVTGLTLEARNVQNKWTVTGLEKWLESKGGKEKSSIPVTRAELAKIPFSSTKLENSHLHIASDAWQMDIPLQLILQKAPVSKLTYLAPGLTFKMNNVSAETKEAMLEATLNEADKKWNGVWQISDIDVQGAAVPIPLIQGKGTVEAHADSVALVGEFNSADNSYKSSFSVDYALNAPEKSMLTVKSATMPWQSGTLSVSNVKVPFAGEKAIRVNLKVQRVSIDALMQMLTGKRVTATGTVSGTLPVTIGPNGLITIHEGGLKAEGAGTIIMGPDAIPGEGEKITLVRDVLKNLHYTNLSIGVNSGKGKKLSVLLVLEGNNPDVYDGRPVKLNVQLTGDVLSLIQESVMPFINPEKLLE